MYARFGYEQLDTHTQVDELREKLELQLDSITAQMLLREAYETSYHIYNHDAADANPLAMVTHHHKEEVSEYGALYRTFYNYRVKDVYKYWGLSITEFLELPREFTDLMMRIIDEEAARDKQRLDAAEEEMKKAQAVSSGKG